MKHGRQGPATYCSLQSTFTTNAQGQTVQGQIARMQPIYQVLQIPGQSNPTFNILEAYVPVSQNDSVQTLAGFVFGNCNYGKGYGHLTVFETPTSTSIDGPALIDARILQNPTVSKEITLLNQGGSSVISATYWSFRLTVRSFISALSTCRAEMHLPVLTEVIAVYGGQGSSPVYMDPTLAQAVADVFGTAPPTSPTKGSTGTQTGGSESVSAKVQGLIAEANSLFQKSQSDLKNEDLGAYENDVKQLGISLAELKTDTTKPKSKAPTSSTPSTTTTTPSSSSSTSTTSPTTSTSSSSTTSTSTATSNAVEKPSPSTTSTTVGSA